MRRGGTATVHQRWSRRRRQGAPWAGREAASEERVFAAAALLCVLSRHHAAGGAFLLRRQCSFKSLPTAPTRRLRQRGASRKKRTGAPTIFLRGGHMELANADEEASGVEQAGGGGLARGRRVIRRRAAAGRSAGQAARAVAQGSPPLPGKAPHRHGECLEREEWVALYLKVKAQSRTSKQRGEEQGSLLDSGSGIQPIASKSVDDDDDDPPPSKPASLLGLGRHPPCWAARLAARRFSGPSQPVPPPPAPPPLLPPPPQPPPPPSPPGAAAASVRRPARELREAHRNRRLQGHVAQELPLVRPLHDATDAAAAPVAAAAADAAAAAVAAAAAAVARAGRRREAERALQVGQAVEQAREGRRARAAIRRPRGHRGPAVGGVPGEWECQLVLPSPIDGRRPSSPRRRVLYYHEESGYCDVGGMVLAPTVKLFCAYPVDGN